MFIYLCNGVDRKKNYNLGQSFLESNPILNPRVDFKYNKYIFPEIQNQFGNTNTSMYNYGNGTFRESSPFIRAGQNFAY